MPRNASGTYSLPSGNPVVAGTTIEAAWANNTLSDVGNELTNSLSRQGTGGMLAALRLADGSVTVPGLAFVSETTTGFYRAASNDMRLAILGSDVWAATSSAFTISKAVTLSVASNLGTPSALTLTNATGLPLTTGVTGTLPVANGGTGITAFGTGVATALGQNVTGSGGIVLATSPTLTTPNLGTPSAVTLTNATGLPIATGVSGLGTGVATALAVNTGSSGAFVVNGGALGTPSSGTVTNLTGTASININGTVGATTPTTGAFTTLSASNTVTFNPANANLSFAPTGTGTVTINPATAGTINNMAIGGSTAAAGTFTSATVSTGNLTFSGTAQRITGDMSNGTPSNRLAIQTNTANGNTGIYVLPNGTSTTAGIIISNNSAPDNSSVGFLQTNSTEFRLLSTIAGTGTYLPMTFYTGGSEAMRITTSRNLLVGTTSSITTNARASVAAIDDFGAALAVGSNASASNWARFDIKNVNAAQPAIFYQDPSGLLAIRTEGAYPITFLTNGANERMRIDSSGNVGIGVVPSAWSSFRAIDIGSGSIQNYTATTPGGTSLATNLYFDGSNYKYKNTGAATLFASGADGAFYWYNAASGTAGNTLSLTERMRIDASGNIVAGASAALATTATDGFLYVPTCAGTPTGTPTAITGMAPIVVNTTNNKLYFYSGGAWRDAGP